MRYFLVLIVLVFLFPFQSHSQDYLTSLSYNTAAPTGQTQDYISQFSWRGLSFEARTFFDTNISAVVFFGWNVFYEKLRGDFQATDSRTISGTQLRYINAFPMLVEGHYYLGEDFEVRPYFGMGVGTNRTVQRTEMGLFAINNNNWHFALAPSAGFLIPTGNYDTAIHLALRYHYAFKTKDSIDHSWLGINLGIAWMN